MKFIAKLTLIVLICLTQWSCNSDDDLTEAKSATETALVGEWLRADHLIDPNVEYKITLSNDNGSGLITDLRITDEGIISSANELTWHVNNNMLHITLSDDTEITSSVEFIDNGTVILANISNHHFIKQ